MSAEPMAVESVAIVQALTRVLPRERVEEACELLRQDALPKLELMAREAAAVIAAAPAGQLADDAEEGKAAELLTRGTICLRELDALRKRHTDPLNAEVKAINGLFKAATERLEAEVGPLQKTGGIKGRIERLLLAYRTEKRARLEREEAEARRKQEEAARLEREAMERAEAAKTEAARKKALADAEAASKAATAAQLSLPQPMPKGVRTDSGTLSARERWTFEVVRPDLVPREYLVPDEKLIRAAVVAGVRAIEGVNIFTEESLTRRPGR